MAKHLIISGRVQGVSYRMAFDRQARALNLSGWVRNRRDGSVEALIAGEEKTLEKMIAWARQGPPAALVNDVAIVDAGDQSVSGFNILPTR